MFIVALECWVCEWVVVAEAAVGAVRMLGALLLDTFSAFALAFAISALAFVLGLTSDVAETIVLCALVVLTDAGGAAVALGDAFDGLALGSVTSLWSICAIISSWALRVVSAIDVDAEVILADLGFCAVFAIAAMVTRKTLNVSTLVITAGLFSVVAGAVLVIGAGDLLADLLLRQGVEVTDVLVVTNVDAVSSSSARGLSSSLFDLEGEATAVTDVVGDEFDVSVSAEGVPLEAPAFLTVLLGVWELGIVHDHEGLVLRVGAAEIVGGELLAKLRVRRDLDIVVTAVLAPVDVHLGELEGQSVELCVIGNDSPGQ